MVVPPRTLSPTATLKSAVVGTNMSTREPKVMKPIFSPFPTVSPGFFQHLDAIVLAPDFEFADGTAAERARFLAVFDAADD